MRGHKAAQGLRVFIVNDANFVGAKIALLFDVYGIFIVVVRWSHKLNLKN